MLGKILKTPPNSILYRLLLPRELATVPAPPGIKSQRLIEGRSPFDGLARAYGLEFGTLYRDIFRDPLYREARALSRGRSVVGPHRQMNIFLLIKFYLQKVPSRNIIELGTWRGGNLLFMARILKEIDPNATVFGLDTFSGMPETSKDYDAHSAGDFSDNAIQDVEAAIHASKLTNIQLVKGDVRETVPEVCKDRRFGLGHIDLDIYDPIVLTQELILQSLVPGGYLVYDDATVSSCPGATLAVEELITKRGMRSEQIFPHFVFRA